MKPISVLVVLFGGTFTGAQFWNDQWQHSKTVDVPPAARSIVGDTSTGAQFTNDQWQHRETVDVPPAAPSNASRPVDPSFPGFAFEEASFVEYAQDASGNPNTFSQNLINAIMSRTGGVPIIRIGGTSGDYAQYIPDQSDPALPVASASMFQDVGGTTIGPSFFSLFKNLPGAKYIFQVPLATNNLTGTVDWTKAGLNGIGVENIQAIQIGNEPDLYDGGHNGQPHLDNQTYVSDFLEYEEAILGNTTLPSGPFFQTLDTSSDQPSSYPVEEVFSLGLNKNNRIKTVANHFYQTSVTSSSDLQRDLMNHAAIAARLDAYRPYVDFLNSNGGTPIPFILSEVGNSLYTGHDYSFQGVFGSALWAVDFQLYSMAIGISRVNMQQILHSGYDLWLPVDSSGISAQVFPPFYAQPMVADFIGSKGVARVSQLETNTPNVVAYAAFESNNPVRVAIINLNLWDASSGTPRPATTLNLRVPYNFRSGSVAHLASPDGAHANASSITWSGLQWTYQSMGNEVRVKDDTQTLPVMHGMLTVQVNATEALIVSLS